MNRVRKAARIAATPLPGDHPGWPGTPPTLADEEGWVNDAATGVARREVGDGTLQIHSLNDVGSNRIMGALKTLYGKRWGETERLEDCGDGRLVWVIEDEDKSAFERALAECEGRSRRSPAGWRPERTRMSRARRTAARIAAADPTRDAADIPARLEYLRGELRAERISYGELSELQSLSAHIDPGDVELLEAAGQGKLTLGFVTLGGTARYGVCSQGIGRSFRLGLADSSK